MFEVADYGDQARPMQRLSFVNARADKRGLSSPKSCRCDSRTHALSRRFVEIALARAGGSRTRAARALGLSRQSLLKVLERLSLACLGGLRTNQSSC